jgi:hypothetical protein
MITLRKEQLDAFTAPFDPMFLARVQEFIHTHAPELSERTGVELNRRIAEGRADAVALGCKTEQEQVLFIVLSLLHDRDFVLREPWSSAILHHRATKRQSGMAMALMDASRKTGEMV